MHIFECWLNGIKHLAYQAFPLITHKMFFSAVNLLLRSKKWRRVSKTCLRLKDYFYTLICHPLYQICQTLLDSKLIYERFNAKIVCWKKFRILGNIIIFIIFLGNIFFVRPLNPLGSRHEIQLTITWIKTHLEEDPQVSLPKHEVYDDYL